YEVPVDLVRRVVSRESTFNPKAYNRGHWGLMQIKHATARGMGYDGPASGLFDAETNLKYAVKYLRGAWRRNNSRSGRG
ncbi:MAG: lytic transglycosylase domain-containing protein, partial [Mesorhizobium sp.]